MMRWLSGVLWVVLAGGVAAEAAETPPAALSVDTVPAAGKQSALLTISRFGRYAITATSTQGTTLQLVDRMGGPGEPDGELGVRDGRLDVFLERGQYKLITRGHTAASGTARLQARAFTERNRPQAPQLVALKPIEGELRDLEQVSYWLQITERQNVWLEAAGRDLADLRLWRDGEWLVDAMPIREYVQPRPGQPMFVYRIAVALDPGLYLLTAYGGPPQPWAEGADAHPFHLRYGLPELGEPARERHVVGPFGIDRFRIPANANYYRVEVGEATALVARVGVFDDADPFGEAGEALLEITKKTVPPVAETLVAARENGERFITVRGTPGQAYVLQAFQKADMYQFRATGDHWISTVHSGHAQDAVDATAILVDWPKGQRVEPLRTEVVELDAKTGWARRANLLATLTVFFKVKEAGAYTVASKGTTARFRLEPFMVNRPAKYQPPPFRDAGSRWDLDAGLYVLTIEPVRKGILDVALKPAGLIDTALDAVGMGRDTAAAPVQAAARFGAVPLVVDHGYTVYVNAQPGVASGLILRALPLDLSDPLPVSLRPGESVTVPFESSEAGVLRAVGEDGIAQSVSVDGGAWQESITVVAGKHTAGVRRTGKETATVSLSFTPESRDPRTPLSALPDTALASVPKWPIVTDQAPQPYDLERQAGATFNVRADKPGLYRLETTGLLAMEGRLRTRTTTSFAEAKENGTGRNALLQQYLREGDYQVTVTTLGQSTGHGRLVLGRGTPLLGGFLTNGVPARVSLPAGAAVSYRFNITQAGRFRLRAFGLGRTFRARLEDTDGWPIVTPNTPADMTRDFEAGKYRLVVLPEATDARLLAMIEPVRVARRVKGHGPHRLALGESLTHVWLEPEERAERVPDAWEWNVPAPVTATLTLTEEMQGDLVRLDASGTPTRVAAVPPRKGWSGALEPGRYRLEAVCSRRNNRLEYAVALAVDELVAGQDRALDAPADLPVSVGEAGLVEITSLGDRDVKARLYDAEGRLVAQGDDRPDDWNFLLVQHLAPGRYRLRVDPVGAARAGTRVSFRVPRDEEQAALTLPVAQDVTLGRRSRLYPLTVPAGSEVLVAELRSPTSVGLALESRGADGWTTRASALGRRPRLALPIESGTEAPQYRLRVWSLDRRESTLRLGVAAPKPVALSEAQLRKGATLSAAAGLASAVARITLERPGLLRTVGEAAPLWCAQRGRACRPQEGDMISAPSREMWLVADVAAGGTTPVRAQRVALGAAEALTVRVAPDAPVVCDLQDQDGPVVVTASSQVGTPGVSIVGRDDRDTVGGRDFAVGARSAVAAASRARGAFVRVWPAAGADPFEVTLRAIPAAKPKSAALAGGAWEGAVDGAQRLSLPDGAKRLRLTLGDGVVAALLEGDRTQSVHWGDGRAVAETVDTTASALLLLPTRATTRASLSVWPLDGVTTLAAAAPYEQHLAEAGVLRVAVAPAAAGTRLHVRGSGGDPTFVGASGRVRRGEDVDAEAEGGTLIVPHGAGWVLAWIDRPGEESRALWGDRAEAPVRAVKPPSIVRLDPAPRLQLDVAQPAMLHFRSASALVTRLSRPGEEPHVDIHEGGAWLDAYLPPGRATVDVRALGGGPLSGSAEIATSEVTRIGEGLGPEALLAPGVTRVFSFEVKTERAVGIGVRADAEVVDALLMDARGRRLARGASQMATLAPGTYLLALSVPSDATPVTARPSIVGLDTPDTGPPEDVIRRYVAPEEEPPSFTASAVPEPSPRRTDMYGVSGEQSTEADPSMQGQEEGEVPVEGEMEEGAETTEESEETPSEGGPQ